MDPRFYQPTPEQDIRLRYHARQDDWQKFWRLQRKKLLAMLPYIRNIFPDEYKRYRNQSFPEMQAVYRLPVFRAYTFLAYQRQEIAQELQHKTSRGDTRIFGAFRSRTNTLYENVYMGNSLWQGSVHEIHRRLRAFITCKDEKSRHIECLDGIEKTYYRYEDYTNIHYQQADGSIKNIIYFSDEIISEQDLENDGRCIRIYCNEKNQLDELGMNRLVYIKASMPNLIAAITEAQTYFDGAWQSDSLEDFLYHIGALSHLLATLPFVQRGNATVTEELVKALADKKGMTLGQFSYAGGLTWDWEAILTPNRKKYATWFAKHAYPAASLPTERVLLR